MGGSVGGAADRSCDERDRIVRGMIVRGIFLGLRLRRAVILAFFAVLKFYVCRKERRGRLRQELQQGSVVEERRHSRLCRKSLSTDLQPWRLSCLWSRRVFAGTFARTGSVQ